MNNVNLLGRLTKDPDIRWSQGEKPVCIAHYTIAVNRINPKEGEQTADYINCVAIGSKGEHAERFYRKGIKIAIRGRIQTGSYTNKDGVKVYTTEVYVEEQEFAESKNASADNNVPSNASNTAAHAAPPSEGFMNIPDGIDEELPFPM